MSNFLPQTYSEDELREIVQNTGEDDCIDTKGPLEWDGAHISAALAKDIAAFANSRDGGFIVIGKEETQPGNFNLVGLSDAAAATFDTTKVATWINNRFSPAIHLVCYPVDLNNLHFVVIRVQEFTDIPAICTKRFSNPADPRNAILEDGRLYIRSPNAASKPLQTEGELRELVGIATKKQADVLLQHFNAMLKGNALAATKPNDEEQTEDDLKLIRGDLVARRNVDLDSGWTFCFHPVDYRKERWSDLQDLEKQIQARGIRTPVTFPEYRYGTFRTDWGIANESHDETWCLSKSGIFLYYQPFHEDSKHSLEVIQNFVRNNARDSNQWRKEQFLASLGKFRWIEYESNMVIVIKAFAFMGRFIDFLEPGTVIKYRLHCSPLASRHLISLNPRMWFEPQFHDPCRSMRFSFSETKSIEELLATWQDRCVSAMFRFFELFPDYNISEETLRKWLDRYIGKRAE
jgi:hypothetical protein